MPKVKFVVEHQVVEAEAGRKLREIAQQAGICLDREFFRGVNCRGLGLCGSCTVWVHPASETALNAPNLRERIHGMGRGRRLACQVKVQGDVEVTSMPGGDDRLEIDRKIDPTPAPAQDDHAHRKPIDEAASIAYPLGHPSAVGKGEMPKPAAKEPAAVEAKATAAKPEAAKEKLSATKAEAPQAKASELKRDAEPDKPAAPQAKASESKRDAEPDKPAAPKGEDKSEAAKTEPSVSAEPKADMPKETQAAVTTEASADAKEPQAASATEKPQDKQKDAADAT